jgi:hypothetical protein
MKSKSAGKLLALAICLSAAALVLAGILAAPLVRSWRALTYSSAEGTVLSSNVRTETSDEGCSHYLNFTYRFQAKGQEYEGAQYRYGPVFNLEHRWAFHVTEANPPGKKVVVYFDPSDPQDAVLVRGIQGEDLYVASFGAPFISVLGLGAWATFRQWRRKRAHPAPGGIRSGNNGCRKSVCLSEWTSARAGIGATMVVMILGVYLVMPLVDGGEHSLQVLMAGWGAIFAIGFSVAMWWRTVLASGKYDLVVDECRGALELPSTYERKTRQQIALTDIQRAWVEVVEKKSDDSSNYTYAPSIEIAGNPARTERLAEWHDREKAEEFIGWLSAQLLPPKKNRTAVVATNA